MFEYVELGNAHESIASAMTLFLQRVHSLPVETVKFLFLTPVTG